MRGTVVYALAVLALLLGGSVVAYHHLVPISDAVQASEEGDHEAVNAVGCGVERWSVKTGTDRDAKLVNLSHGTATNILHMRSLAPPSALPASRRIRPVETTVWTETATILRVKIEADHDYHLVLADAGGRTMIAEIPDPYCVGSSSPFRTDIARARHAVDQRYTVSDAWQRINAPVQITGVGFFDFKHGQSGVAPNAIELHPVLAIRFGKTGSSGSLAPPPPSQPSPKPPSSGKGFGVQAWVSPSSMPYGAYPTLYAKSTPGAVCTASVTYSTGRSPVSFDGSSRTVGRSGKVSWSWHEETSGSGGTATVTCTLHGQTRTTPATFTVSG